MTMLADTGDASPTWRLHGPNNSLRILDGFKVRSFAKGSGLGDDQTWAYLDWHLACDFARSENDNACIQDRIQQNNQGRASLNCTRKMPS